MVKKWHAILSRYRLLAPTTTRLSILFVPVILLVADTTSILCHVLVKLSATINIDITLTCLVHLIVQPLFSILPTPAFLLIIENIVRAIVLRPMYLV
jgi:hypothetical protein